jgi:tetratricopeptide (TPR) repeat protein
MEKYAIIALKNSEEKYKEYIFCALNSYCIEQFENNDEERAYRTKKYCQIGIENNIVFAMTAFGSYYYENSDYDNMKKYFLMAIDKGCNVAMFYLGEYYKEINEYDNMKKYFLMAIEKGDKDEQSIWNLAEHYKQNNDEESSKLILDGNYKMTEDYKRIFPEKCSRCLDKYIKSSKSINCIHKDICNECIINITACPKCGTKYE